MPSSTPKPNPARKAFSTPVPVSSSKQNWKQNLINEKKKEPPTRPASTASGHVPVQLQNMKPPGEVRSHFGPDQEHRLRVEGVEEKNKETEENEGEKKNAEDAEHASAAVSTSMTTTNIATAAGPLGQGEGVGRGVEFGYLTREKTE
ncbi:hypothetical protein DL768_009501 [Monosporascus sp. mg162]|nr:hypothetical protein DL768_009501 [Monosporascus sp. mg162]